MKYLLVFVLLLEWCACGQVGLNSPAYVSKLSAREVTLPPHAPSLFYDFTSDYYFSKETNDVGLVSSRGSDPTPAGGTGSTRPKYLGPWHLTNGLPQGRIRYDANDVLTVSNYAFGKRSSSIFCILRTKTSSTATFFHSTVTNTAFSLYTYNYGEVSGWNSSRVGSGVGIGHGVSVPWMLAGTSSCYIGCDSFYKSNAAFSSATVTNARIGLWTSTTQPFTDDMLGFVYYNKTLSLSQKDDVLNWANENFGSPNATNTLQIDCSGDSRTQGVITANPQTDPHERDTSYPAQLQVLSGRKASRVLNFGHGGAKLTNYMVDSPVLTNFMLTPSNATVIVIGFWGHNDIVSDNATTNQLASYMTNWIANLRAARPSALISYCTLPYPANFTSGQQAVAGWFNAAITNGEFNLDWYYDLSGLDTTSTDIFSDTVHCTVKGYKLIAEIIKAKLVSLGYLQ